MTPVTLFFGDGDHDFALNLAEIKELQIQCNATIGTICNRVFVKHFSQSDIAETIRLALIGAGEHPKRAADLVALYVTGRPFTETYPIANTILETVWFGEPHEKASK
ncbi:MAG: gene transfer agent family protein [Rhizobiales bacterium]|nr:gene transfer agent family protein [Hyphomicrobiales bacterium]